MQKQDSGSWKSKNMSRSKGFRLVGEEKFRTRVILRLYGAACSRNFWKIFVDLVKCCTYLDEKFSEQRFCIYFNFISPEYGLTRRAGSCSHSTSNTQQVVVCCRRCPSKYVFFAKNIQFLEHLSSVLKCVLK